MVSTLAVAAVGEDVAGRGGGEEAEGHTQAMGGAGGKVEVQEGTIQLLQEAAPAMVEVS